MAKKKGDDVVGGTLNENSVIKFRATKIGKDTVLSQIIELVRTAQGSRPDIQRIADKAVSFFIPVVLAISAKMNPEIIPITKSNFMFGLIQLRGDRA